MKTVLIAFFATISIVASSQTEYNKFDELGRKHGIWKKYQDNGKLLYEGTFLNGKPVGEFKRYHSNGALKALLKHDMYSDTASVKLYNTRAKLIAEGTYLAKLKIGTWKYYKNKLLISEENYVNNIKHGSSKTYYPDGKLFEKTEWKFGLKDGLYQAHYKNGKPYLECRMVNNKRDGYCIFYYPNNEVELEAFYKMNLRHNEWKYFNQDGTHSHTLIYENGTLMNPEVSDSIQNRNILKLENKNRTYIDPETFMQDPMQYMIRNKMIRR